MSQTALTETKSTFSFLAPSDFVEAQRICQGYASSTLVPEAYRGNVANCLIALEIAMRLQASALMVMQNLYIVHGKPGWSAQFVISAINSCGKYRPLRFEITGKEGTDEWGCVAWTTERHITLPNPAPYIEENLRKGRKISVFQAFEELGVDVLKSPRVSIKMAKDEKWYDKTGSKWKTLPELMLMYRSASFFGRLYAPEIMMGMQTAEELEDHFGPDRAKNVTPAATNNAELVSRFTAIETVESIPEPTAVVVIPEELKSEQSQQLDLVEATAEKADKLEKAVG